MLNPAYALTAAFIWAFSSIYYGDFLKKFDFLSLDLLRTSTAAVVLGLPALAFWGTAGLGYASLAGVITLACGDSLFLLSIREMGASITTPVVYTYVLMVQLAGVALGQVVPFGNIVAAIMVVAGVYVLSRGGEGKPRGKGIAFALVAGVIWTVGNELLQFATNAGGNFVVVTFARNSAAALALGIAFLLLRRDRRWPSGVTARQYAFMLMLIISDLVVGSSLFVYSISSIGVALTVILTGLSPLLTQVFARALGKESPSYKDFLGGVLVVAGLVLAVAY